METTIATVTRGDIFWVDLPERDGSVQGSIRPAIITSNDMNNKYCSTVNVIPLTSQLEKADYPMHVLIGTECGLDRESVALCEQETTVTKKRLKAHIGHCTEETQKRLEKGIMIQRGISDPFNITKVKHLVVAIQEANRLLPENNSITRTLEDELRAYCRQYGKTLKSLTNDQNNKARQYA